MAKVITRQAYGLPSGSASRFFGLNRPGSGDEFADHMPMNVGEAEIAAGVAEGQLFVVEAEQPQHRRVQIVHVHFVFHRAKAKFIRGAVNVAAPYSATG